MNAMHQFAMSKFATKQSRDDAMLEEIDMLQGKVKDLSAVLNHHKTLEAECRVPEGYVLVPMEPTAEQMEAVINRYCHYNDAVRDEYRTYNIERLRHDYIAAVAAAPKPEKAEPERKLNSEPTIAAPVAQDPTAFLIEGFDGNGKRVAAVIQQNADNARNSASVFAEHYPSVKTSGLYLAPPDQSAEVEFIRISKKQHGIEWQDPRLPHNAEGQQEAR